MSYHKGLDIARMSLPDHTLVSVVSPDCMALLL